MTKILANHIKASKATPSVRVRKVRKVVGWCLTIFCAVFVIALMRGVLETFLPGWAFYTWE